MSLQKTARSKVEPGSQDAQKNQPGPILFFMHLSSSKSIRSNTLTGIRNMGLEREPSLEYILSSLDTIPIPSPISPLSAPPTLSTLPPELYSLILPHLPYPDALSLKHTSRQFYTMVDTSIRSKVAWLLDRHTRGLQCPRKKCILKTDASFCESGGGEVKRLMERRRRHEECGPDRCEVVLGRKCDTAGRRATRRGVVTGIKRFDRRMEGFDPRLVLLAVLILIFSFLVNVGLSLSLYQRCMAARISNS